MIYLRQVRHAGGVMYLLQAAILGIDLVTYVRHGSDDIHVKLAVQTFLHNLHMQQAEETAAEAESQRHR